MADPPALPEDDAGMKLDKILDESAGDSNASTVEAAAVAAEKEAIKAAAEAAAREEEMRRRAEAEVEARRQAAKEAEKKKEGTKEQMGALQVRGSLTAANEIWQMLSGGNGAPKWRRVMHHDTTGEQSHRTEWTNFLVTKPVQEALAAAAGFGWKVHKTAQYRINRQGGDTRVQHPWSFRQDAPAAARPPLPPRGAPAPPHPGTTAWGRRENAWGAAHQQNEAWLRQAAKSKSEVEEVKEVLEAFKKEMQEFVKQELSGKAAAPPAAAAAPGAGGASERALEVRVQELESKVGELTASNGHLQQLYSESYHNERATKAENLKLKKTIEEQAERLRRTVPPFVTPDKVPDWIPVSPPVRGGIPLPFGFPLGFSAGVGGLAPRRLRPSEEGQRFRPPENSAFPFAAFVPMPMAPVAPVAPEGASATGEAPLAVAATGSQPAAEEKVAPEVAAEQRHEVREQRRNERKKKVDTEAGGQVAGDKGAKQEARQEEGTRVRQPDRQPGASGDTPEAKEPRSGKPGPVSPEHWQWKGHTGPAEGPEWSTAGKKNSRGIKPTIC
jgi:type II secretory pathway component PulJ